MEPENNYDHIPTPAQRDRERIAARAVDAELTSLLSDELRDFSGTLEQERYAAIRELERVPRFTFHNGRWVESDPAQPGAVTRAELDRIVAADGLALSPLTAGAVPVVPFNLGTTTPTTRVNYGVEFNPQPDITAMESARCAWLFAMITATAGHGNRPSIPHYIDEHNLGRHIILT